MGAAMKSQAPDTAHLCPGQRDTSSATQVLKSSLVLQRRATGHSGTIWTAIGWGKAITRQLKEKRRIEEDLDLRDQVLHLFVRHLSSEQLLYARHHGERDREGISS